MDRDLALQLITKLTAVVEQLTIIAVNTTPAETTETTEAEPTANTSTRSAKK